MAVVTAELQTAVRVRQPATLASSGISNGAINVDLPFQGVATSITNGLLANQIDLQWVDRRTLASATAVTLDLAALAAAATNTGAAAFSKIMYIMIRSNETADSGKTLTIGNAASLQFAFAGLSSATATVVVKSGGSFLFHDPSLAGQSCASNKNLLITPSAATHDFTIVILGRSA